MTAEGVFPKVDGDVLYGTEANTLYTNARIRQIYTGTGYNSTISNVGTDTQDHELDAITSTNLTGATYLIIRASFTVRTKAEPEYTSNTQYKIQTKETGGAYSDSLAYVDVGSITVDAGGTDVDYKQTNTFEYIHTLTAGEKSNGVQVKLFSSSIVATTDGEASFTNIQTVLLTA